jgi:anti-anti-sigma factor
MPLEELRFTQLGDAVVAQLIGEVDISNARSVRNRLVDATPNTATALVLDLSRTDYLDSSGMHLIFELAQRLRSRGQKFKLVVPDDSLIRPVLVLTDVPQVVPLSSSVQGALDG